MNNNEELTRYEQYLEERCEAAGLEIFELAAENRNLKRELSEAREQLARAIDARESAIRYADKLELALHEAGIKVESIMPILVRL